ncbi:MAG: hypothetical protein K2M34_03155 [Alphaproteobacteria bacterium]|nr:hypothetical protein [Alphaproteobacteria bacterium]
MNKIIEILKSNKYVIMWTVAYIAIAWAILLFMFNFNIFVGHQWQLLMHAEIKGFAGFVFGILMLAALPMYIATTAVIIRTKQPLITVNIKPVIKIFTAIIPQPVPAAIAEKITNTDYAPQITTETENGTPVQSDVEFPNAMPEELRGAFIRARQHIDQFATSAFNATPNAEPISNIPVSDATPASDVAELPLPTDFNFDSPVDSDFAPSIAMPTFTDISFDDDDNVNDNKSDAPTNDTTAVPTSTNKDNNDNVVNYLTEHGYAPRRDGDMIIANNIIIATHDDPAFWIADPETWFAAGKQKPSPINQLIKESAKNGLRPVLYLAQTNILELDTCRAAWDTMGVTSITDLSELPLASDK